jgi:hypothetical protein
MSERTPGPGRRRGRDPDDWLEHSGSSVFGKGRDPSPPPAPPADPPGPPPRTWNPAPWAPVTRGGPLPPEAPPPARTWDPAPWATAARAGARPAPTLPGVPPGEARPAGHDGWPPPRPADRCNSLPRVPARGRPAPAPRSTGPRAPGGDTDRAAGTGLRSPIGLGAVVGLAGLVAFLAALLVLPWFTVGDDGVTLADIRSAFSVAATDPGDVVPGAGEQTGSTLPDGAIPTPDEITDAAEQQARDAAGTAAAAAIDSGRSRYLELYTDVLWLGVAVVVAAAAIVSTLLAPRSAALSLLLGVRRIAGAATVLAVLVHGAALWVVFSGDGAPSPSFGVWLGLGGLAAVLAGCVIGPRR